LNAIIKGLIAGAAGTAALNIATYGDMALRGRPSSTAPAQLAGILAGKVGLSLSAGGADDETVQNRQSGLGALLGYVTGLGVGAVYGAARPALGGAPAQLTGLGVGLLAMAASDVPLAVSGVSDPKTWSTSDWASDLIPHLIYGFVVAAAYEAVAGDE